MKKIILICLMLATFPYAKSSNINFASVISVVKYSTDDIDMEGYTTNGVGVGEETLDATNNEVVSQM